MLDFKLLLALYSTVPQGLTMRMTPGVFRALAHFHSFVHGAVAESFWQDRNAESNAERV